MTERKRHGRKLLIASIGVAAVSYVACGGDDAVSNSGPVANLMAPAGAAGIAGTGGSANTGGANSGGNGGVQIMVGNLMVTPVDSGVDTGSTIKDAAVEKGVVGFDVLVANLIAPPPPDAKDDTK